MTSTQNNFTIRIHIIGDYGGDQRNVNDLAFAEVENKFTDLARMENSSVRFEFSRTSVGAFNTIEAAFVLAQRALNQTYGANDIYFVNVAPRKDNPASRSGNQGEKLVVGVLPNGAVVFAVNAGATLSFLRDAGVQFYEVKCDDAGSQFRSRDVFVGPTVQLALDHIRAGKEYREILEDWPLLGPAVTQDVIASVPKSAVLYIDGFGNIKLNLSQADIGLQLGDTAHIEIGDRHFSCQFASGIFGVKDGDLVLAPGSSGWRGNQFLEIVKRGGNAAHAIGFDIGASITPGQIVKIEKQNND